MKLASCNTIGGSVAQKVGSLAYSSLKEIDLKSNNSPLESYFVIKAFIVTGELAHAKQCIADYIFKFADQTVNKDAKLLSECLSYYYKVYSLEKVDIDAIEGLYKSVEQNKNSYLCVELRFLLGYCLINKGSLKKSTSYLVDASRCYLALGLTGPAAVCQLNLCIVFNNMGERKKYLFHFSKLEELYSIDPIALKPLYSLMAIYRLIDIENYETAFDELLQLQSVYQKEGRNRDLENTSCLFAYLNCKLNKRWHYSEFINLRPSANEVFIKTIKEFHEIDERGYQTIEKFQQRLKSWAEDDIDCVDQIFMIELIASDCLRLGDYLSLLQIVDIAKEVLAKSQHSLNLVDFRYYEALATIHLGSSKKATKIATSYRNAAKAENAPLKIRKSLALFEMLSFSGFDEVGVGKNVTLLELDSDNRLFFLDGLRVDLGKKPLIFDFISLLATHQDPLSLAKVFEKIYSRPYFPLLHQERLNSLIARARKVLGSNELVIRVNGTVRLNRKISIKSRFENGRKLSSYQRKRQIVKYIKDDQGPVKLSDLIQYFNSSKRTLQNDLKALVDENTLFKTGKTKSTTYLYNILSN